MIHYNHTNISNARNLRKNMTPWERKLWYCFLKSYPVRFQRQKCIDAYIADFYCYQAKLIVELDGSQHYDKSTEQKDALRTQHLSDLGLRIIRIANNEIDNNFEGVCEYLDLCIKERVL